jgi:hypothetical protein
LTFPLIEPTIESFKKKREARATANQKEEDFIKMLSLSKLFIARTLLCATIVVFGAQGQHARGSSTSAVPSVGNNVILCKPGFVYRCNKFGCFCVRP